MKSLKVIFALIYCSTFTTQKLNLNSPTAQDINSKKLYAVKRESLDLEHPQLHHESMIYDLLVGGPCIPSCDWYGQYDGFNCIVIDLLGSSLKDLQQSIRNIPLEIIIDIGCQLVRGTLYIIN